MYLHRFSAVFKLKGENVSIKLQYANTTLNANKPFKNSTTLFHDASQMRKVEAAFNANIPFKNHFIASFYHTIQGSEFEVTLNANVSSKSLKLTTF